MHGPGMPSREGATRRVRVSGYLFHLPHMWRTLMLLLSCASLARAQCPFGSYQQGSSSNETCVLCSQGFYFEAQPSKCTACPSNSNTDPLLQQELSEVVGSCTSAAASAPSCSSEIFFTLDPLIMKEDPILSVWVQITDYGSEAEVIQAVTVNSHSITILDNLNNHPHGKAACDEFLPVAEITIPTVELVVDEGNVHVMAQNWSASVEVLASAAVGDCCNCSGLSLSVQFRLAFKTRPLAVTSESCRCNAGYSGPDGGACAACGTGTYKSVRGSDACQPCAAGNVQPTAGSEACDVCPAGTYADAEICVTCPQHSTSAAQSEAQSSCLCNAGYTGPDGGACEACGFGSYKSEVGNAACASCAPGQYTAATGSDSSGACLNCELGTFLEVAGAVCDACPPGPSNSVFLRFNDCQWSCDRDFYAADGACAACPPYAISEQESISLDNCTNRTILLTPGDDLKAEIEQATSRTTFVLAPGTYTGACGVGVTRDVTVEGSGGEVVLDCQGSGRHFSVEGASLTLVGLTLVGGASSSGGCVLAQDAHVTVRRSALLGCTAFSSGGAIYASSGSVIELADAVTIAGSSASAHGGSLYLAQSSLAAREGVVIRDSSALGFGGCARVLDSHVVLSNDVTLHGCTTSGTTSSQGGAVYLSSSSSVTSSLEMHTNVTLRDCSASRDGGVVYATGSSLVARAGVQFLDSSSGTNGGCLRLLTASTAVLSEGVTLRGCSASLGGAAVLTSDSSLEAHHEVTVADCSSSGSGGAFYLSGASVEAHHNVTVEGCSAGSNGGAVYLVGAASLTAHSDVVMQDNSAVEGGCLYLSGSSVLLSDGVQVRRCDATSTGGAAMLTAGSTIEMHSAVTLEQCSATSEGGVLYLDEASAVVASGGVSMLDSDSGTFGGCLRMVGAEATLSGGVLLRGCATDSGQVSYGGAIAASSESTVTMHTGVVVEDGYAFYDGGAVFLSQSALVAHDDVSFVNSRVVRYGGCLRLLASTAVLSHRITLRGCTAQGSTSSHGGGAYLSSSSSIEMHTDVTVRDCAAGREGGAVYASASSVVAHGGVQFLDSSSATSGGCLRLLASSAVLSEGVTLRGCTTTTSASNSQGGAAFMSSGSSLEMHTNVTVRECVSIRDGGAMYVTTSSSLVARGGVQFLDCSSSTNGGCLRLAAGNAVLSEGVTLRGCSAGLGGAAVLTIDSSLEAHDDVTVADCSSTTSGGAFYLLDSNMETHHNVTVEGCSAGSNGGAFYLSGASMQAHHNVMVEGCSAGSNGGAFYLNGANMEVHHNVTVEGCSAASVGGAFFLSGSTLDAHDDVTMAQGSAGTGGFIYASEASVTLSHGVVLRDAEATSTGSGGGCVRLDSSNMSVSEGVVVRDCVASYAAGIRMAAGSRLVAQTQVEFVNCRAWLENGGVMRVQESAVEARGGVMFADNEAVQGAVAFLSGSTMELSDGVRVLRNHATGTGGAVTLDGSSTLLASRNVELVNQSAGLDGGVFWAGGGSSVELSDGVEVRGAEAGDRGGLVFLAADSTFKAAHGVLLERGVAKEFGGGVFALDGSHVELVNGVTMRACMTAGDGGGVWLDGSTQLVARGNVSFEDCAAVGDGGGLRVGSASSAMLSDDVAVSGCSARVGAAVLMVRGALDTAMPVPTLVAHSGVVFRDCHAVEVGGGISLLNARGELSDGVVVEGCSAADGGGLHVEESELVAQRGVTLANNTASDNGGGLHSRAGVVTLTDRVTVEACTAQFDGGGVYLQEAAQLHASQDVRVQGNEGGVGGGVFLATRSAVELGAGVQVARNRATGRGGGGVAAVDGAVVRTEGVSFVDNRADSTAAVGGGGLLLERGSTAHVRGGSHAGNSAAGKGGWLRADDSTVVMRDVRSRLNTAVFGGALSLERANATMVGCSFHAESAHSEGGCVLAEASMLDATDCEFVGCVSGESGGGFALLQDSWAGLRGQSVFAEGRARRGGGLFVSNSELELLGGTLHVHSNTAASDTAEGGFGGGIYSASPVYLRAGTARLEGNRARAGGGWYAVGSEIEVAQGAELDVERCTAVEDGGGLSLELGALLKFGAGSCPALCQSAGCQMATGVCMNPTCNFQQGRCNERFEEAGPAAAQACDRSLCSVFEERQTSTCANQKSACLTAACDWAEDSSHCRAIFDDLASCPLFDAAAYASLIAQPDLVYVKSGGPANGFGRCNSSGCFPWNNTAETFCQTLDDDGRVLEQVAVNSLETVDAGQAWGLCSERPRLPSAAFDYDPAALLALADMPLEDVLRQHPGCGWNPVRFLSNTAGGRGGGLYNGACDVVGDDNSRCFVGDVNTRAPPTAMFLFHNNSASAGGGIFTACPRFGVCERLLDAGLALPSSREASVLELRANTAPLYGHDVAGAAQTMQLDVHQAAFVPGQDLLNLTAVLFDSLGQAVHGGAEPYVLQMLVCRSAAAECSLTQPNLQPALFLLYDDAALHTAEREAMVRVCELGAPSVQLHLSLSSRAPAASAAASVELQCLPCPAGHEMRTAVVRGVQTWTCERCEPNEYVLDADLGCQRCPAGAECNGASLVGEALVGGESRWEPDLGLGIYRLVGCPTGYGLVNGSESGGFDAEVQRCEACGAGAECVAAECRGPCRPCAPGSYKADVGLGACELCAVGTFNGLRGADSVEQCLPCQPASTTAQPGQASQDACLCDAEYYAMGAGAATECRECPAGAVCSGPDRSCALANGSMCGADRIEGTWSRRADGEWELQSCPQTREKVAGSHDLQECRACLRNQYIVDGRLGHRCFDCPAGALCDGARLVTRQELDATGQVEWEPDQEGRLWLRRCPTGYRLENAAYELQECQWCGVGMFVLRSDDPQVQCQRCPTGFTCLNGGPPVRATAVTGQLSLAGLDLGGASSIGALRQLIKTAILRGLGTPSGTDVEVTLPCATVPECQALLAAARRATGALDVQFQAVSSSSGAADLQAALNSDSFRAGLTAGMAEGGQTVEPTVAVAEVEEAEAVGEFEVVGGQLLVRSCPAGYLLVNASLDDQRCSRCEAYSYSMHFLDGCQPGPSGQLQCGDGRQCQSCPQFGVRCLGGDSFEPLVNGSVWTPRMEGSYLTMRLDRCPPGHVLIRTDLFPEGDQCVECGYGNYSIVEAVFPEVMVTERAQDAQSLCQVCPSGAECPGRNILIPLANNWIEAEDRSKVSDAPQPDPSQVEVRVYRCPLNACRANGECETGRDGPMCSLCKDGWSPSGNRCRDCESFGSKTDRDVALGIFLGLFAIFYYAASWSPFFAHDPPGANEVEEDDGPSPICGSMMLGKAYYHVRTLFADFIVWFFDTFPGITDYLKILISFWQVQTTYQLVFRVNWPSQLRDLWNVFAFMRFDFLTIPRLSCLTQAYTYLDVLVVCTLVPLVVSLLFYLPVLLLRIKKITGLRRKRVEDRFWFLQNFWLFLLYPFLCGMATNGLQCVDIGGERLLRADVREACPLDEKHKATFVWTMIMLVLYPVGVPLYMLIVMRLHNVPKLAKLKYQNKVLGALLAKYKEFAAHTLAHKIALYVGSGDGHRLQVNDSVIESRSRHFFDKACQRFGVSALGVVHLERFLQELGVASGHHDELDDLVASFDIEGTGQLGWEQFRLMIQQLVASAGDISGFETIQSIEDEQILKLCRVPWNQLVKAEADEQKMGLAKELSKRLKKLRWRDEAAKEARRERENAAALKSMGVHDLTTRSLSKAVSMTSSVHSRDGGSVVGPAGAAQDQTQSLASMRPGQNFAQSSTSKNFTQSFTSKNFSKAVGTSTLQSVGRSTTLTRGSSLKRSGTIGQGMRSTVMQSSSIRSAGAVSELEEEDQEQALALYAVDMSGLGENASRDERLQWLLKMGKQLIFIGVMAIPTVRWDSATEEEEQVVDRIGFLFDAYKVQYWYFELIEMFRKLFMAAIVSFMYDGTEQQIAAGLFVTSVFLMGFLRIGPYFSLVLDSMQGISVAAQAATLFYGLMKSITDDDPATKDSERAAMRVIVYIINLMIFALPFYAYFADPARRHRFRLRVSASWRRLCGKPPVPSEAERDAKADEPAARKRSAEAPRCEQSSPPPQDGQRDVEAGPSSSQMVYLTNQAPQPNFPNSGVDVDDLASGIFPTRGAGADLMGSERGGDGGGVIDLMSGIDLMGSGGGGGGGGVIDLMGGGDDGAPHLPPLSHLDISPESSLPGVEDALAPRRISEVEVGGVGGDKGNGVSEGQTQDMIDRFELQSDDGRWSASELMA